ncbi:hypothetical protein C8Q75DRAFT_257992 [Abortiporus biennis]|nr:hypothetical protein C8Q75DRAFT_257992 [Abortiporus biennis]
MEYLALVLLFRITPFLISYSLSNTQTRAFHLSATSITIEDVSSHMKRCNRKHRCFTLSRNTHYHDHRVQPMDLPRPITYTKFILWEFDMMKPNAMMLVYYDATQYFRFVNWSITYRNLPVAYSGSRTLEFHSELRLFETRQRHQRGHS